MTRDWLDILDQLTRSTDDGRPGALSSSVTVEESAWLEETILTLATSAGDAAPAAGLRQHVLRSIDRLEQAPSRDELAAPLARWLDVDEARASALLEQLDAAERWTPGPVAGIALMPVVGGAATAGAMCVFVRIAPGAVFPPHWHAGQETTLVLTGGLRDEGVDHWAGDVVRHEAGGPHAPRGIGFEPCVALVVAEGGVSFSPPTGSFGVS